VQDLPGQNGGGAESRSTQQDSESHNKICRNDHCIYIDKPTGLLQRS